MNYKFETYYKLHHYFQKKKYFQVTTVSTDLTTPITVTLGARELLTEIIEPTTMVQNNDIFLNYYIINKSTPETQHLSLSCLNYVPHY